MHDLEGPLVYYDRTASQALLDALKPKGVFPYLAEIAHTQHLADLQLRGYPGKKRCWATLYVGLTKVLDVFEKRGEFWLKGKAHPLWDTEWEIRQPADHWHTLVEPIRQYLDATIGGVAKQFTNEGAVQAMLCTRASALFSVIDREAVIGFSNTAERISTYERLQKPLHDACVLEPAPKWFKPKKFGGELDLLAVDPQGRLLVIEIKPGSSTSGITWAPLQAMFYAELFRAWSAEAGEASHANLQSMLKQRVTLGLTQDPVRSLRYPLEIVPVIAIGGEPSNAALARLWVVRDALLASHADWSNLEVWRVEESVAQTTLLRTP